MAIRDHLRDTTDTIQPTAPTPRTTGTVLGLVSGTIYNVQVGDEVIPMRSAGNNTLTPGTSVSVMYAGGDYPWCCDEDAGYRSLVPLALGEFFDTKPASAWMLYVLQDNPRNYTYRQGINIGHPETYVMAVQGLDGDTVNLPVEYAGTSARADLIPIGDPVVMHQLYPQKWIVIGREGADVSVLIYMSGIFDYPLDPCGSYWMRAYKPSEGVESQWTCDSCVEVSPGMFTCESGHFWPPIISPWEDDFVTYSYITAAAGIEANLSLGDTLEFSWPYGSFDGSDDVQCFIRQITGPTDAEYQLSYTLTYIEDSIEKALTGTYSLITRTTDQIFTGIAADSTTISSVTLRVTLEAA